MSKYIATAPVVLGGKIYESGDKLPNLDDADVKALAAVIKLDEKAKAKADADAKAKADVATKAGDKKPAGKSK